MENENKEILIDENEENKEMEEIKVKPMEKFESAILSKNAFRSIIKTRFQYGNKKQLE